ncbi:hypothetical protein U9M48_013854 [Paspalum notatum var. saurae]|uniref:Uncharacterized protein n=1 Tax=Paspalum notatum var. saurae TaxID=547442 RepID=A0AAQ3WJY9_PASNO
MLIYQVVALQEFQIFEDKSTAINAGTGVNEQLAGMIKRWHRPRMKLGVGKPEYKTIIETKLGITCMHNEPVMEVMWGIQQLMHILVPDEKAELTKENRLPMSKGLKMLLTRYGFDVKPEMVNKQIVVTAQTLFACDSVDFNDIRPLWLAASAFEEISGINYEHWDAVKLATALKVVCCPEEEIYPNEVLTQDELSKLKGDALKYEGMVYKAHCLMMYKEIVMILPAISASKQPSSVHGLPLPKVSKRSWDSAFEETVANKSIFSKGSSLGETLSRKNVRKWGFSGAQPSTSKDIVPYVPVRHAVLLRTWAESRSQKNDSVDADCNMTGLMEQAETLGIEASSLALAGDSMDEAITAGLLAEHSEQNEANILENVQQSAYSKSSLQQKQGQDHGPSGLPSSTPPLVGKVVRLSPKAESEHWWWLSSCST